MRKRRRGENVVTSDQPELPIACTLSASELRARGGELLPGLVRIAQFSEELPDGRRYRFAPDADTLHAITRVIENERQCCRFFRFRLTVDPDLGPFWLEITGPAGTREFLSQLLD
jgi:hypothetical protein